MRGASGVSPASDEQALPGKLSELTGMKIVVMGKFRQRDADQIAGEIKKTYRDSDRTGRSECRSCNYFTHGKLYELMRCVRTAE